MSLSERLRTVVEALTNQDLYAASAETVVLANVIIAQAYVVQDIAAKVAILEAPNYVRVPADVARYLAPAIKSIAYHDTILPPESFAEIGATPEQVGLIRLNHQMWKALANSLSSDTASEQPIVSEVTLTNEEIRALKLAVVVLENRAGMPTVTATLNRLRTRLSGPADAASIKQLPPI